MMAGQREAREPHAKDAKEDGCQMFLPPWGDSKCNKCNKFSKGSVDSGFVSVSKCYRSATKCNVGVKS
jgi:hypothetical protein